MAASWKLPAFLNPRRDGAVLPILHLNGYKISGPTVMGRADDASLVALLAAEGWDPVVVVRRRPRSRCSASLYAAISNAHAAIGDIHRTARAAGPSPADGVHERSGGRRSSCAPPRDGPVPTWWTASRWPGRSGRTRSRWPG